MIVGALDTLKFWTALKLLLAGLLLKDVMQIIGVCCLRFQASIVKTWSFKAHLSLTLVASAAKRGKPAKFDLSHELHSVLRKKLQKSTRFKHDGSDMAAANGSHVREKHSAMEISVRKERAEEVV